MQVRVWISRREMAGLMGVGEGAIRRLARTLPVRRLELPGERPLYHRQDVEDLMRRHVKVPAMHGE